MDDDLGFYEELSISKVIEEEFQKVRGVLDSLAYCIQGEAIKVQQDFRGERAEHQQEYKKGRAWAHDVRIKNTRNGVSIEWFHYKGKYKDLCTSEGIRSEGQIRVPARNFQRCSAIEKIAIRSAEDRFAKLRQMTQHVSKMAEGLSAIKQMQSIFPIENSPSDEDLSDGELHGCGHDCDCETPCDMYLAEQKFRDLHLY